MKTAQGMRDALMMARDKVMEGDYQGYSSAISGIFQYPWEDDACKKDWKNRFDAAFFPESIVNEEPAVAGSELGEQERLRDALTRPQNLRMAAKFNRERNGRSYGDDYYIEAGRDILSKLQQGRTLQPSQYNLIDVIVQASRLEGLFSILKHEHA